MDKGGINIDKSRKLLLYSSAGLIALIFSLTLLEFMSAVYFEFFSEYFYRPLYLRTGNVLAWRTEFEPWGSWHKPNAKISHRSPCFAVNYTSNSIGARDVERPSPGLPNSVIFLGDSFIEGYGVSDEERLSNIFEQKTGKLSFNLGATDLGPLQYLMLYEAFAHRFSHDTVVIGFLPANDFTDNDPKSEYWQRYDFRYRPYYKKTASGYEIFYKGTFENGRTIDSYRTQPIAGGKSALLHYTWTGGFLFTVRGLLPLRSIEIFSDVSNNGYFETSRKRLEAAYYFLDKIVRSASGKKVYILIIPTYSEAKELRARSSPWLSEFIAKFE